MSSIAINMKPILFNTDMVRAILEGRKTVTRRVVKPQPKVDENGNPTFAFRGCSKDFVEVEVSGYSGKLKCVPPYQPSDILYVRETWTKLFYVDEGGYTHYDQPMYFYAADGAPDITLRDADGFTLDDQRIRWCPSIHMPKEAARIFLRVTDVRVERLQANFTEPICPILELQTEGIDIGETCQECIENYGKPCCVDTVDEDGTDVSECGILDEVRDDFSRLWDSTINPADRAIYGWEANPWVWVVEFERISREGALRNA